MSDRLPLPVKIGYGAASGAIGMMYSLASVFFLIFLTDVVEMAPAKAGFVIMLGMLCDACLNPTVGVVSDRLKGRWGRRRPFLFALAVPYGVVGWLLFTDFGLGPGAAMLYFSFIVVLYYGANAGLEVPYTSLAAEMTQDYDERTSIMGFRIAWSQIGSIVGAALPPVAVAFFASVLGSEEAGWSVTVGVLGLICIPAILLTWRVTRGREVCPEAVDLHPFHALQSVLRNRAFRYVVGLWTFGGIALGVSAVLIMYFMTYALDFSEDRSSVAMLIFFACGTLWIPVINKTSARFGKRFAFGLFIGTWGVAQAFGAFFIYPGTSWMFFAALFVASSGVVTYFVVGYPIIADVVEVDEFKSGHRREGFYFGTAFFVQKVITAVAVWGVGLTLSIAGYEPGAAQSDTVLTAIRGLYGWGAGAAFLLSILFCYLMPINRANHSALLEAMRLKKEGKPYSTEGFEDLLR